MAIAIDLTKIDALPPLAGGAHAPDEGAMCVMEAVAFVAGEPWSDSPACVCHVIAAFCRAWNDGLPDDERDRILRPLIPRLIGTRATPAVEQRRALMAADWLVREHTPAWLRLAGLTAQADALAALPEITDMAHVPSIRRTLEAVRKDADAARAAARDAWDAWNADRAAAGARAGAAAADAAANAACDVAGDVAGAAAGAVAWAAAAARLKPTRDALQVSALRLLERMIACGEG